MPSIEPGIRTSVNTMLMVIPRLEDKDRLIGVMREDGFKASILDYLARQHKEQRFVLYHQDNLVRRFCLFCSIVPVPLL